MFNSQSAVPSLSDIAAVTNNDGFGGNNGWWIIIILFALFGGWGNRGWGGYSGDGSNAVQPGYVLNQDFSILERKLDGIANGICDSSYATLNQTNGINNNIFAAQTAITAQNTALQSQMAACCCEQKNQVATEFANLNYNLATQMCNTRQTVVDQSQAIIANDNANFRALNDRITAMEMNAKDQRIADLQAQLQDARFAASQSAQNEYLIGQLRPAAIPAYTVPNPYANAGSCNCYNGCC